MSVVAEAIEKLASGCNLMWTQPLVEALGVKGRELSVVWVGCCIRRLLPYTEIDRPDEVIQAITDLQTLESSPSQAVMWELSYDLTWPRWYAARIAVCHLYRAWWYSRFLEGWQFAYTLEAALHIMLNATGRAADFHEVLLEEYQRVAKDVGGDQVLLQS